VNQTGNDEDSGNGMSAAAAHESAENSPRAQSESPRKKLIQGIYTLLTNISDFAKALFQFDLDPRQSKDWMRRLSRAASPDLVRIVDSIAVGGPGGSAGWAEIFWDRSLREELVVGIIARVLKDQVFLALAFGASAEQEVAMTPHERYHREKLYSNGRLLHGCLKRGAL
jgi:hypothetical protein